MRSVQSTLFTLLVASSAALADTQLNLTPGVSPISHDVYELHMTVFWICVVIGVIVFGAMFYAIIFHRKDRGVEAAQFHSHPWLEITWTIVPAIILILMAIPATKVLLNMNNYEKEEVTIKITGYQWKWHYEYLEDGVSFFSNLSTPVEQLHNLVPKGENYLREVDHPLVVPIHKKIRFLITSNDVNHAWWVADLAVKRDALAGFINEAWTIIDKPGTYRGQCAELCGINHAFMPIVVVATTDQGYKDWVAKQKGQATQGEAETNKLWSMQDLMKQGEQVYSRICTACHQPGGTGLPPTFPALKGGPIPMGPIPGHVDIVFNGKSGTAMQAFKGQLTDVELAGVITYERNAFGNNTGTQVQPIQIKAYRDGKPIEEALKVQPSAAPTAPGSAAAPTTAPPTEPGPGMATPPATTVPPATTAPAPTTMPPMTTHATPSTMPEGQPTRQTPPQAVTAPAVPSTPAAQPPTPVKPGAETKPVASTAPSPDALKEAMARGEKVYLSTCAICHQPGGTGLPPTFPALKGGPIPMGPVDAHLNIVMNGKTGTAMQAFKEQLNDQDLADVITYERNAWGNNKGTLVTPDMIKSARNPGPTNSPSGGTP